MKQYLLVTDEFGMERLKAFSSAFQFLEVQGMDLIDNVNFKLLVVPVQPPVPPAQIPVPQPASVSLEVSEVPPGV